MEYQRLGETGLEVSPLCLGTWRFGQENDGVMETDRESAHELLDAFAEHGGNFIDTANGYGQGRSEEWIGEWLADRDREDFVVASKCYWSQVSTLPGEPLAQERPRRGRGLPRQARHRLPGHPLSPPLRRRDAHRTHPPDRRRPGQRGRFTTSGSRRPTRGSSRRGSGRPTSRTTEAFTVTQPLFHAAYYEDVAEYLDVCADQNLAVCPYSPLAGGFLTGKYERAGDGTYELDAPEDTRAALDDRFLDFYVSERGWRTSSTRYGRSPTRWTRRRPRSHCGGSWTSPTSTAFPSSVRERSTKSTRTSAPSTSN